MIKKYWWIVVPLLCGIVVAFLIGIPKTEWPEDDILEKEVEKKTIPKEESDTQQYLAPPSPDFEKKQFEESAQSEQENRVQRLTPKQEATLQATNYNAYIRYRAKLERGEKTEELSPDQIIEQRIAPRLKAHLEKNS